MKKVLFLTNVPSPYRVDFFNEFGRFCDLTVLFEKKTSDERDESWKKYRFENFRGIFLDGKSISADSAFCPSVIKYIRDKTFDHIICSNFSTLTGLLAIWYMKTHSIFYFLECDGGFAKNGKGMREAIKRHLIRGARGYFSTCDDCDQYYLTYGATRDRLIRYPFTSLRSSDILKHPVILAEKKEIRKKLGITEEKMILAVGQFIYRKGFDILLKAVANMSGDIGVYFVGGNPSEEYIQLKENLSLKSVHFIGFKGKADLAEYYKAADIFVLPTREDIWGLVVQEAMAYGLPVISTDRCAAAKTVITNEENGFIVPGENVECLAEKILDVLNDPRKQCRFANKSLEIIQEYTIERMSASHIDALDKWSILL